MGLLSEFKKLFFTVESVTKSAADKAAEAGKEASGKVTNRASELFEDARDAAEDFSENLQEKAGQTWDKAKDTLEDVSDTIMDKTEGVREQISNTAEQVGKDVLDKTAPLRDKVADTAESVGGTIIQTSESVGKEIFEKGGSAIDKTKNLAENIGATILGTAGAAKQKASDFTTESFSSAEDFAKGAADSAFATKEELAAQAKAKMDAADDTMDHIIDKAKNMGESLSHKVQDGIDNLNAKAAAADAAEAQTKASPKMGYDNAKGSLLDGQDDFFAKAEKFAQGDYHGKGKKADEESIGDIGDIKITKDPNYQRTPTEGTVAGFEDLDGDGNEIIDDAIIDED